MLKPRYLFQVLSCNFYLPTYWSCVNCFYLHVLLFA